MPEEPLPWLRSDLVGEAHWWLNEWQRSRCGATLMELAQNLPSRGPEKDVLGEVFYQRHITTELPTGDAKRNCRLLAAPGHYAMQEPGSKEVTITAEAHCWEKLPTAQKWGTWEGTHAPDI